MMVPLNSGERALRALEQRMPWMLDKRIPEVAQDGFAVAVNDDNEVVALVRDVANDRVREVPLPPNMRDSAQALANPIAFGKRVVDIGPAVLLHAERLLAAPWC